MFSKVSAFYRWTPASITNFDLCVLRQVSLQSTVYLKGKEAGGKRKTTHTNGGIRCCRFSFNVSENKASKSVNRSA